jgi:hypothetical protein
MAAWITIAVDDMNDVLVGAQMNALRTAALADGQQDPFVVVMRDRCNYIRNRIAGRVRVSQTAYAVPPELRTCALMLILEVMQARLAPALKLKDDQVRLIERAYKDLDIAGTDDLPISTPDDAIELTAQSGNGSMRVVARPTRTVKHSDFSGI